MEQQIFRIPSSKFNFRIAKMNAIELFALQTQFSFDSIDDAQAFYSACLERIEVEFNDNWYRVKEKGKDIFYPAGIEDDLSAIQELMHYFMYDFMKPVFTKSNALKEKTE